jgi:hypothetical protein
MTKDASLMNCRHLYKLLDGAASMNYLHIYLKISVREKITILSQILFQLQEIGPEEKVPIIGKKLIGSSCLPCRMLRQGNFLTEIRKNTEPSQTKSKFWVFIFSVLTSIFIHVEFGVRF